MTDLNGIILSIISTILSGGGASLLTIYVQRRRDKEQKLRDLNQTQNEQEANIISFASELRQRLETLEDHVNRKDEQLLRLQNDNRELQSQYGAVLDQNARLQLEVRALRAAYQEMIVRQEQLVALVRKTGQEIPASIIDPGYALLRETEISSTPPEKSS